MRKILIVQSRSSPDWVEREKKNFLRAMGDSAEVEFLSALDERLAWSSPDEFLQGRDGVIFGGSSDFDFHGGREEKDPARLMSMIILSRARNIVTHAIAEHLPVLGVCFGHQLIAQMYGGDVQNDPAQGKFGSYEVHLSDEGKRDPLFSALPPSFYAQYWHKDSVTDLPEGATLLATGTTCRFSALRYGDNIYTVQFHPEVERIILDENPRPSPEASRLVRLWVEHITVR
jgi:GMP synthase (glutamine-hydrolysing)